MMDRQVMIVDDEPSIRLTVSLVLKTKGFNVLEVESGTKCISELEHGFKGVILMDIMMPDMDGWTTIREIVSRNLMDGNAICILSATDNLKAGMEALGNGIVTRCIRKPFEPSDLVSQISEISLSLQ